MPSDELYHLALASDWREAQRTGRYTGSTIGRGLEEEGFVHCSFAIQVRSVADRYYRGRDDVVLLRIDPAGLGCEVRVEAPKGASERFPHVYGPIPLDAVRSAQRIYLDSQGRLNLPDVAGEVN